MYRVMIYGIFQDEYKYIGGEYSGCYHETVEEAETELKEANRYCKESGYDGAYIEEVLI